jgi:cytochrome c oxidase cbb3-type subunit 3
MNTFWSLWVIFLITLNLGIAVSLFAWGQHVKVPTLPDGTTGHIWAHGVLRESVRKLPLWWALVSAATFLFAIVYLARYPGFGSYAGALGWTQHHEHAQERGANLGKLQQLLRRYEGRSLAQLATDAEALAMGERLYVDNCAACHGRDARGNPLLGAPNLSDADALYGNDETALMLSIMNGRAGIMPPLGAALAPDVITATAHYARSLSGLPHDAALAQAGQATFTTLCAACHTPEGTGNVLLGAPNLTDSVWLLSNDHGSVENLIRIGRNGRMPNWNERLGEANARLVAAWLTARQSTGAARP